MSQRPPGRALTCFNSSIKPLNYTTQNLTKLNIPSREVNLSMSEQGPHKKGPCQKIILAINKKTSLRSTICPMINRRQVTALLIRILYWAVRLASFVTLNSTVQRRRLLSMTLTPGRETSEPLPFSPSLPSFISISPLPSLPLRHLLSPFPPFCPLPLLSPLALSIRSPPVFHVPSSCPCLYP